VAGRHQVGGRAGQPERLVSKLVGREEEDAHRGGDDRQSDADRFDAA
jgi:hypothetical protein